MRQRFIVNSCSQEAIKVTAEFEGQPIESSVHGLVVELVSEDGRTSQTLRYRPQNIANDEALFTPGAVVTATYAPE